MQAEELELPVSDTYVPDKHLVQLLALVLPTKVE